MIRVLHGYDEFSASEAYARIVETIGPPEVRGPNTSVFDGRAIKLGEVVAAASAGPFLADRRLVTVRGLLGRLQAGDKSLGDEWDKLASRLEGIPPTTELVFFDIPEKKEQELKRGGRALKAVGPLAEIREFQSPRGPALENWIRERFASNRAQAQGDAVARLAWLSGGNLRLLDQEVRKLVTHASGRPVSRQDVDLLVTASREESIFAAVDAILEHRPGVAMKLLYSLLAGGETPANLLNMLARQVRLALLARDMWERSVPRDEIGKRAGIKAGFPLEKTMRQAERFDTGYLSAVHHRLLDADLAIKTGELDERLAVEILVARLSTV
ncbi:MAG: DNA polymerase III subunit delta [Dehalococcoidia bacterium]|nr:DNA polymerase III subunit delta [Dehalococcoidia bacterium]